jgi:protein involved in polysaccharide export with SLBB domain
MRSFQIQYLAALGLLITAANSANAQSTIYGKPRAAAPAPTRAAEISPEPTVEARSAAPVSPNSPLTAGAGITLRILEENEPAEELVVGAAGSLELPGGLGSVPVGGLTVSQAESRVRDYLESKYYKPGKGAVQIGLYTLPVGSVKQAKVLVSGKLARGGASLFPISTPKTLSEVVLEMGVTPWSNLKKVKVTRRGQSQIYDVKAIMDGTAKDVPLEDGDAVSVPEKGAF